MRILSLLSLLSVLVIAQIAAKEQYFKIDKQIRHDCTYSYAGNHEQIPFGHGAALVRVNGKSPLTITCRHHGRRTCSFTPQANALYVVEKRHHRRHNVRGNYHAELFVCDSTKPANAACQICK